MNNRLGFFTSRQLYVWIVLLTVVASSCARKVAFIPSTVLPAAEGRVKIKKDDNGNHAIKINVRNFADPQRLAIPQNTYVVWMESSNGLKNLGQLKSESNLLSSARKGEMETVTPHRPSRIFITGESDGEVQFPSNQVVLSTRSF